MKKVLIKKENLAQVIFWEFNKTFKKQFFTELLWATASVNTCFMR